MMINHNDRIDRYAMMAAEAETIHLDRVKSANKALADRIRIARLRGDDAEAARLEALTATTGD